MTTLQADTIFLFS